ncbi:hypothetical protein [Cupriavidus sp. 8B]
MPALARKYATAPRRSTPSNIRQVLDGGLCEMRAAAGSRQFRRIGLTASAIIIDIPVVMPSIRYAIHALRSNRISVTCQTAAIRAEEVLPGPTNRCGNWRPRNLIPWMPPTRFCRRQSKGALKSFAARNEGLLSICDAGLPNKD